MARFKQSMMPPDKAASFLNAIEFDLAEDVAVNDILVVSASYSEAHRLIARKAKPGDFGIFYVAAVSGPKGEKILAREWTTSKVDTGGRSEGPVVLTDKGWSADPKAKGPLVGRIVHENCIYFCPNGKTLA